MLSALSLSMAFLPGPVKAAIFGLLAILAVVLVLKIVKLVLDAIPFL